MINCFLDPALDHLVQLRLPRQLLLGHRSVVRLNNQYGVWISAVMPAVVYLAHLVASQLWSKRRPSSWNRHLDGLVIR